MEQSRLEETIQTLGEEVKGAVDFSEDLWISTQRAGRGISPMMHQMIRIYEAVKNGSKRMMIEDTTSAGKTFTAIAIKGMLDKQTKGKKPKALVIAPNQAIASTWNESEINKYAGALDLPTQKPLSLSLGRDTLANANIDALLRQNDMFLVNFEKLSRADTEDYTNVYMNTIMKMLPNMDMVIVDECHNLKNIMAGRTERFREIVERTKNNHFLMLSATAIPNRLEDAGFLLYMFDPVKYRNYANNRFSYAADRFSIRNAVNSGKWFRLTDDDLRILLNLQALKFGDESLGIKSPHTFLIDDDSAREYFEKWREQASAGKVGQLSQILLRGEMNELERLCRKIAQEKPEAQMAIWSFYTEGFSREMAEKLNNAGIKTSLITGSSPDGSSTEEKLAKRNEIAEKFRSGEYKATVNTFSTVGESISFSPGDRPVYVIFAQPPITPASRKQIPGRFNRIFQKEQVYVVDMLPQNAKLREWMESFMAKIGSDVKHRRNWRSTTVFDDSYDMCENKRELERRARGGMELGNLIEIANVAEGEGNGRFYRSIIPAEGKQSEHEAISPDKAINDGAKAVRGFAGHSVNELVKSEKGQLLVEAYDMPIEEYLLTTSADTNKAITRIIKTLEEAEGRRLEGILDWGCGPACLARILRRPIYGLDAMKEMIAAGRRRCLQEGLFDEKTIDEFLRVGDAKAMPFKSEILDLVSTSYAMPYNAQGFDSQRDIERIFLETNRVLRTGGYGIIAVPIASATNMTTKADIDNLTSILPKYGFNVLFSNEIAGFATNQETGRDNNVFRGAHIMLYQKKDSQTGLASWGEEEDGPILFSPYKVILAGGFKGLPLGLRRACAAKKKDMQAERFIIKGVDGSYEVSLENGIRDAISGQ